MQPQRTPANNLPEPHPDSLQHSKRVSASLVRAIETAGGSISFGEFMQHALYAPGLGYYVAGTRKFGADGDFVTAPEVSPLFGRVLATQCAAVLSGIAGGRILELGAGSGALAVQILQKLEELDCLPERYQILDVSADLRDRQQELIREQLPSLLGRVEWIQQLPAGFRGVFVANEVADALPVERFIKVDGEVAQLRVALDESGFVWRVATAPEWLTAGVRAIEKDLGSELPDGYQSEFSPGLQGWIGDLADSVQDAVVLLFDYGIARHEDREYVVIDTGGVGGDGIEMIESQVVRQVEFAVAEADAIVLVLDSRDGITAGDQALADRLRRTGKSVSLAVNKSEGLSDALAGAEFHALGLGAPRGISALHGHGVRGLVEEILERLPVVEAAGEESEDGLPRLAVIGRPNVGKSTLINRLVGDERVVTSPEPGTTRDSIDVRCERDGERFVLVDTAGIRRRSRVDEGVEKFSVVQSLRALEQAGAAIVLIDAREGVTDQDLHLVGLAAQRGSALVIGINKWDGMGDHARRRIRDEVARQLRFVPYAEVLYLSALHGSGISEVVQAALAAYRAAGMQWPTPRLNEVLKLAMQMHAPPLVRGRQIRLRYAHQGGRFPPLIIIHGSQADRIPAQYRRYLENSFREMLKVDGVPLRVEFRSGDNPFAGRRNQLTPRQQRRRQRLIKHSRGR